MRHLRRAIPLIACVLLFLATAPAQQPGDCGYYLNRDGETVPRPCGHARDEPSPPAATAVCRDGEYSYSRHHAGTCSGARRRSTLATLTRQAQIATPHE